MMASPVDRQQAVCNAPGPEAHPTPADRRSDQGHTRSCPCARHVEHTTTPIQRDAGSTASPTIEKPSCRLETLRRADQGDPDAMDVFARWAYAEMERVLRRYTRYWSADDFDDAVQLAVCHVVEHIGHCRAVNDYQLRAWIALIGWRAVLRDRLERRSLDARPAVGVRHDADLTIARMPDDASAPRNQTHRDVPSGSSIDLLAALTHISDAAYSRAAMATPERRALHRHHGADDASFVDARARWTVQPPSQPQLQDGGPPKLTPSPAQASHVFAREHAALVHALLCRFAVEGYTLLPESTQHMFWARLVEGASWATVAAQANTTPAAAKRRLQRAARTLASGVAARVLELSSSVACIVRAYCVQAGIVLPDRSQRRQQQHDRRVRGPAVPGK